MVTGLDVVDGGRHHDLPVTWDGRPVTWRPWSVLVSSLRFHVPAEDLACRVCGLVEESAVAIGSRQPVESATVPEPVERRTRSGRKYLVVVDVPERPSFFDLLAYRCRGCGHDVVHDVRTGEWWDLDVDDYGPGGSTVAGTLW